jgi:hypothetical protein
MSSVINFRYKIFLKQTELIKNTYKPALTEKIYILLWKLYTSKLGNAYFQLLNILQQ